MLSYPSVLAFQWFAYPVATCEFVLKLPWLRYLILPEFDGFTLVYLAFAVFKPSLIMLGFPMYVS